MLKLLNIFDFKGNFDKNYFYLKGINYLPSQDDNVYAYLNMSLLNGGRLLEVHVDDKVFVRKGNGENILSIISIDVDGVAIFNVAFIEEVEAKILDEKMLQLQKLKEKMKKQKTKDKLLSTLALLSKFNYSYMMYDENEVKDKELLPLIRSSLEQMLSNTYVIVKSLKEEFKVEKPIKEKAKTVKPVKIAKSVKQKQARKINLNLSSIISIAKDELTIREITKTFKDQSTLFVFYSIFYWFVSIFFFGIIYGITNNELIYSIVFSISLVLFISILTNVISRLFQESYNKILIFIFCIIFSTLAISLGNLVTYLLSLNSFFYDANYDIVLFMPYMYITILIIPIVLVTRHIIRMFKNK